MFDSTKKNQIIFEKRLIIHEITLHRTLENRQIQDRFIVEIPCYSEMYVYEFPHLSKFYY